MSCLCRAAVNALLNAAGKIYVKPGNTFTPQCPLALLPFDFSKTLKRINQYRYQA